MSNINLDSLCKLTTTDLKTSLKGLGKKAVSIDVAFGQDNKQTIELTNIPTNLGIGLIWYFLCPLTRERCKVLYFYDGWFVSRKALKNTIYDSQIYSPGKGYKRALYYEQKMFDVQEQMNRKHLKKTYGGKETKIYAYYKRLEAHYEKMMERHDGAWLDAFARGFDSIAGEHENN